MPPFSEERIIKIKALLQEGKIKPAIDLMLSVTEHTPLYRDVISIASSYHRLQRKYHLRVLSDNEVLIEEAKITHHLLDLTETDYNDFTYVQQKRPFLKNIFILLGFVPVCLIMFYITNSYYIQQQKIESLDKEIAGRIYAAIEEIPTWYASVLKNDTILNLPKKLLAPPSNTTIFNELYKARNLRSLINELDECSISADDKKNVQKALQKLNIIENFSSYNTLNDNPAKVYDFVKCVLDINSLRWNDINHFPPNKWDIISKELQDIFDHQ